MLGPCRLRRARFKPGRKLTGHYDVLVHVEGTEGYGARPIAVTWRLDGDADRHQAGDALVEMQAEALRQGIAAPFRQLTAELPEWSMHVQVSPLDARFPQLVRLSDPRYVRARLATRSEERRVGKEGRGWGCGADGEEKVSGSCGWSVQ